MKFYSLQTLVRTLACASAMVLLSIPALSQEPPAGTEDRAAAAPKQDINPELMRSFLHLQEQVHATQLAIERTRTETEAATSRNAEALNARLKALEQAMDEASKADTARTEAIVESNNQIRQSNNNMMTLGVLLMLVVTGALGVAAWLQWKAISRIAALPANQTYPALLPQSSATAGGSFPTPQIGSTRMMEALGRLEHRIADMEEHSHAARPLKSATVSAPVAHSTVVDLPQSTLDGNSEVSALIREGEEILSREDAAKAIAHFDSILAKHPGNPEVLLRKGTALERLNRDQEAIECYDLAIQADGNLTMAYLHKGGLFNRMERFSEAMECYEKALRVQEGRRAG